MSNGEPLRIEVGVYYFPQYHPDPQNDRWHGEGWTEWELLKRAEPRFPGHQQPKVPLWGYEDEADPQVMERKIAAAADAGISTFLYDWYWYAGGPFLQRGLEEGFLRARNADRLKFALMWANHDWLNLFPHKRSLPTTIFRHGAVTREEFDAVSDYLIARYFGHPAYWRVEGKLYFSIYELATLVEGLGGVEATRAALDALRARVAAAGLGELHLNAVVWGVRVLPSERVVSDPDALVHALGFDSVTSYVWIHHTPLETFPATSYPEYARQSAAVWGQLEREFTLPYFPNVTMGWDPSPRTAQSDGYADLGYPFMSTLSGNTPQAFQAALEQARAFLDARREREQRAGRPLTPPILTLNAWNEWTEGSYLEPDERHGMAYLDAIRTVFGVEREPTQQSASGNREATVSSAVETEPSH